MSQPGYRINCPACNQGIRVAPEQAGKRAKCPKCQQSLVIPPPPVGLSAPASVHEHATGAQAVAPGPVTPPMAQRMDLSTLRTPAEKTLRAVCLVITCILGEIIDFYHQCTESKSSRQVVSDKVGECFADGCPRICGRQLVLTGEGFNHRFFFRMSDLCF